MQSIIEFEISDNLKKRGISSIRKEGSTIVVVYNDIDIRFDINSKSWTKTIQGFKSSAKDIITNGDFLQAISANLSKNYPQIINLNNDINVDKFQIDDHPDSNEHKKIVNINELESKIPDKDFAEYVIGISKRTVKCEDSLVLQILYTGLSAYSKDPINLAIIAPTSEGKTYPVMEVMKYFPKDDVWNIGAMSTKALVRTKGILVDSNNESIEPKIKYLRKRIKENKGDENEEELNEQLKSLVENSKTLIDLRNKIIIFLEPPNEELYGLLKPILSHDREEMDFPYVDKNNIITKNVVARGFPSFIVCSAKDESRWSMWSEIQSRFLITSPNMIPEKYRASNRLIAQKKGLPNLIQQQVIVSDDETELAKGCLIYLKDNICKYKENHVWIPYGEILTEILPAEKGTTTRITNRIFSFINVVSLVKEYSRSKLVLCEETSIIATLEDLSEALSMTQNLTGVPVYKMKFFNEIFYPCYKQKKQPDKNKDETKEENIIAVTTKDLCEFHGKVFKKSINSDNLKKTYLNELINNGMIEQEVSNINNKQYIYFPIVEPQLSSETISLTSSSSRFDKDLHHSRLLLPKNCINIPEDWLTFEVLGFLQYRNRNGNNELIQLKDIKLFDMNGSEITIKEFCEKYEKSNKLARYVYKPEICNFNTKSFGSMKLLDVNQEKEVNSKWIGSKFDMKDNNSQERIISISKSQHLDPFVDQNAN